MNTLMFIFAYRNDPTFNLSVGRSLAWRERVPPHPRVPRVDFGEINPIEVIFARVWVEFLAEFVTAEASELAEICCRRT
ncbi:hypothetical protein L1987_53235 [Smallanthus sonchifolius]|uniref:Uncharacterized protein n=1 Tax=Smallanthus sonchifolius TaxID=185202 RepID=A0ACB9EV16_9ASTR|nr:hypothetical protein L1987_53235 [Smallanthus sonchifolius]